MFLWIGIVLLMWIDVLLWIQVLSITLRDVEMQKKMLVIQMLLQMLEMVVVHQCSFGAQNSMVLVYGYTRQGDISDISGMQRNWTNSEINSCRRRKIRRIDADKLCELNSSARIIDIEVRNETE